VRADEKVAALVPFRKPPRSLTHVSLAGGWPACTLGPEIIVLLALGPPLAFLLPFLSPLKATLASVGALAGYADLSVAVWSNAGLFLPLASGLLLMIALFALDMSYGCFVESRSTRQFTELFESLTVLFADIRGGFTSSSETLEPKELARIINDYLTAMSVAIRGARRTLDKHMGTR
jgi:adenylate cyclase